MREKEKRSLSRGTLEMTRRRDFRPFDDSPRRDRFSNTVATMSSDSEPVVAIQSEKQRLKDRRREALARLKDASQSRKSRPQPRFLGAGGDDDDEDGADEPVDFDRWDRQSAERRQKQQRSGGGGGDISSSARPQRRSPSPLRDPTLSRAFDDLFDLGADGQAATNADGTPKVDDDLDLDDAPAKKRRIVAKLDEERLLGPSGFPLLREHMKKLKIKGKGHEVRDSTGRRSHFDANPPLLTLSAIQRQDLKRVLTMYQLWSHQMYPKTNLRDTLVTVEKLCHKRTIQVGSCYLTLAYSRH